MKHNQLKPIAGSPKRYGSPNKKVGFGERDDPVKKSPNKKRNSKAAINDWSLQDDFSKAPPQEVYLALAEKNEI